MLISEAIGEERGDGGFAAEMSGFPVAGSGRERGRDSNDFESGFRERERWEETTWDSVGLSFLLGFFQ